VPHCYKEMLRSSQNLHLLTSFGRLSSSVSEFYNYLSNVFKIFFTKIPEITMSLWDLIFEHKRAQNTLDLL